MSKARKAKALIPPRTGSRPSKNQPDPANNHIVLDYHVNSIKLGFNAIGIKRCEKMSADMGTIAMN